MNPLVLKYERSVTRCYRRIRDRARTTVKQDKQRRGCCDARQETSVSGLLPDTVRTQSTQDGGGDGRGSDAGRVRGRGLHAQRARRARTGHDHPRQPPGLLLLFKMCLLDKPTGPAALGPPHRAVALDPGVLAPRR